MPKNETRIFAGKTGKTTALNSDSAGNKLNAILAANHIKRKMVEKEPTQSTISERSATIKQSSNQKTTSNQRHQSQLKNQKTRNAATAFWGNTKREGIHHRRSPPNTLSPKLQRNLNRRLAATPKRRSNIELSRQT